MAMQKSVAVRNAQLDAIETAIGTSAILKGFTGTAPANCAAASTGTTVFTMTLPSDWMAAAASGVKGLSGVWQDTAADATGTVGYFRIFDSTGTTCHLQGTVTGTGGGGDLTLDNPSVTAGQNVLISSFNVTAGGA